MKTNPIKIWTFAVLLAFVLAASGFSKLSGAEIQIRNFESWNYPLWTRIPIGLAEMALAAGLLWPKTRFYAILLNFVWVILAIWTHLQASPAQQRSPQRSAAGRGFQYPAAGSRAEKTLSGRQSGRKP